MTISKKYGTAVDFFEIADFYLIFLCSHDIVKRRQDIFHARNQNISNSA